MELFFKSPLAWAAAFVFHQLVVNLRSYAIVWQHTRECKEIVLGMQDMEIHKNLDISLERAIKCHRKTYHEKERLFDVCKIHV